MRRRLCFHFYAYAAVAICYRAMLALADVDVFLMLPPLTQRF